MGAGSTFTIYLPEVSPCADVAAPGGTETVLLAENDADVLLAVGEILRQHGYVAIEASDGVEALWAATEHNGIDLLITDMVMPRMRGAELAKRFAEVRPGTPALLTSGYIDEVPDRQALRGTPHAFIRKPFTPDVLLRQVQNLIGEADGPNSDVRADVDLAS
jgi:two-component system cell cycle sensor histidine kinase/response regulator CckA